MRSTSFRHRPAPPIAARAALSFTLLALLLACLCLQKALLCDPPLEAAAERTAACLSSLRRAQGDAASRITSAAGQAGFLPAGASGPSRASCDRRVAEKEVKALRARKEAKKCAAELRAALSALGGAEPSLGDGNGTAQRGDEAALLRRELKKAAAREATLSARLVAAKAELSQLRERLLLPPAVDEASPEG
jgi:hypothetical protein